MNTYVISISNNDGDEHLIELDCFDKETARNLAISLTAVKRQNMGDFSYSWSMYKK